VFGDETSLGLAAALNRPATHLLLEVSDVAQAMPVIDYLRLDNTHVRARLDGDAHCPLLAEHLAGLLMDDPAAGIILTGRARPQWARDDTKASHIGRRERWEWTDAGARRWHGWQAGRQAGGA
jgi:hypothetical protein